MNGATAICHTTTWVELALCLTMYHPAGAYPAPAMPGQLIQRAL